MYIMCVILCLFSALSHRVGALQISIIIIIGHEKLSQLHGILSEDVKTKRRASTAQLQSLVGSLSWPCRAVRARVFLRHIVDTFQPKLQALVYDILPSTTAVFSYAIGSRKLSANEQFFCWCSNSSKFVTNNSNKTRRVIYSRQQSLHQHK